MGTGHALTGNLRFRTEELVFKVIETAGGEEEVTRDRLYEYLTMIAKALEKLKLEIEAGLFTDSEIIVMLGENGTEKTTFIRMPAELMRPDDASVDIPESCCTGACAGETSRHLPD